MSNPTTQVASPDRHHQCKSDKQETDVIATNVIANAPKNTKKQIKDTIRKDRYVCRSLKKSLYVSSTFARTSGAQHKSKTLREKEQVQESESQRRHSSREQTREQSEISKS
jgi:hypothetical protein